MQIVLHEHLPEDLIEPRPLPGVQPASGPFLRVDEAYAGQMAVRREVLERERGEALAERPEAAEAVAELWEVVQAELPEQGFQRVGAGWLCPDGVHVADGGPLETLGRLCQSDFCLMQKADGTDEHVLTAGVLCFPASWRLSEKIGRPLVGIHAPVAEYDPALARRVQRLFDGVQVGRPLWRFNRLWYEDAQLFQPRSETVSRPKGAEPAPYLRCERQTLRRLERTRAVVFSIHTYVVTRAVAEGSAGGSL